MLKTFYRDINWQETFSLLFFISLIFLLSFPIYYPDTGIGLDASYFTFINDVITYDISAFKYIVHSFGPLGFIKAPLAINNSFETGLIFNIIIKVFFIGSLFVLGRLRGKTWLSLIFIILILSCYLPVDFFIYGIVGAGILLYWETGKQGYIILSIIFTVLSIFIKINIGITSSLILFSYVLYDLYRTRKARTTAGIIAVFLCLFLICWLCIYQTFSNLFIYTYGWLSFSLGNADFSSLFPPNNLFLLFGSVIIFYGIPFLFRKKDIWFLYAIFGLAFFVTFKYSIARQEGYHSKALLDFMIFFSLLYFIYIKDIKPVAIGLLFIMIMFYYRNLSINKTYGVDDRIQLVGINNFHEVVINNKNFVNYYKDLTKRTQSVNKLPDSIRQKIGNHYTDFFPWDYTYIHVNNLNYLPRPTLQTGALYTPLFLDKLNAEHVRENKKVKYIIWEKEKWNGELGGIDDKYLLNGDAAYIYETLNNYKIVSETPRIKLLERTKLVRLQLVDSSRTNTTWNEWVPVPEVITGYVRAKIKSKKGISRAIKAALYKTGAKYIDYKLQSGKIIRHRFSEDAESSGMWINPYLTELTNELKGEKVIAIKFSYTDTKFKMKNEIEILWEKIELKH